MPNASERARNLSRATTRRPLTRERIIRAALRLIDERGQAGLTMRRLGDVLEVKAMSLYKHVKNKEDVIRGAVDLVQSKVRYPEEADENWQGWFSELSKARRAQLLRHPKMVPYLLRYGEESPITKTLTERSLERATSAGLHGENVHHLLHLLAILVHGSAQLDRRTRSGSQTLEGPSADHPLYSEYEKYFRQCDGQAEFEFGLELILHHFESHIKSGIESRL